MIIKKDSAPRLVGNWIVENGRLPVALRPGIEAEDGARPQFGNNIIARNGVGSLTGDAVSERSK